MERKIVNSEGAVLYYINEDTLIEFLKRYATLEIIFKEKVEII